jgi:hypothetical protein
MAFQSSLKAQNKILLEFSGYKNRNLFILANIHQHIFCYHRERNLKTKNTTQTILGLFFYV